MQYETPSSNLPNLKYGREMEERAKGSYHTLIGPYHSNFAITKTGLQISVDYPHLVPPQVESWTVMVVARG